MASKVLKSSLTEEANRQGSCFILLIKFVQIDKIAFQMSSADEDDDHFGLPDPNFKPLEELGAEKSQEKSEAKAVPVSPTPSPVEVEQPSENIYEPDEEAPFKEDLTIEPQPSDVPPDRDRFEKEEQRKRRNVLLAVLIPAILLIVGFFVFQYFRSASFEKEKAAEAARKAQEEQRLKEEQAKKAKEIPVIKAPSIPESGTIQTLTEKTGRYYVIVHSSIDGELIMDQAKKFSAQGLSTSIIPPFGKWKFNRLAITSEGTFSLAQQQAEQLKEKYGQDLWVLRY